MLSYLKQELIEKILAADNENLLLLLKSDYDYFIQENLIDVTDELSSEDKEDLDSIVNEPFGKNTVSQQGFDEAIREWRTK